uniref:Outer membrane lipoprotein n=1 Tax=Steinernema glaseri TaxID=37863 RepID=A0A1I8APC4_9BILA
METSKLAAITAQEGYEGVFSWKMEKNTEQTDRYKMALEKAPGSGSLSVRAEKTITSPGALTHQKQLNRIALSLGERVVANEEGVRISVA